VTEQYALVKAIKFFIKSHKSLLCSSDYIFQFKASSGYFQSIVA